MAIRAVVEFTRADAQVETVRLAADLSYVKAAAIIALIVKTSRQFGDNAALLDDVVFVVTKGVADATALADAMQVLFTKGAQDAGALSDALEFVVTKGIVDPAGMADVAALIVTKAPFIEESAIADSITIDLAGGSLLGRMALNETTLG